MDYLKKLAGFVPFRKQSYATVELSIIEVEFNA
jgi:hypothetical protein